MNGLPRYGRAVFGPGAHTLYAHPDSFQPFGLLATIHAVLASWGGPPPPGGGPAGAPAHTPPNKKEKHRTTT
jgi:hypothetical protein